MGGIGGIGRHEIAGEGGDDTGGGDDKRGGGDTGKNRRRAAPGHGIGRLASERLAL